MSSILPWQDPHLQLHLILIWGIQLLPWVFDYPLVWVVFGQRNNYSPKGIPRFYPDGSWRTHKDGHQRTHPVFVLWTVTDLPLIKKCYDENAVLCHWNGMGLGSPGCHPLTRKADNLGSQYYDWDDISWEQFHWSWGQPSHTSEAWINGQRQRVEWCFECGTQVGMESNVILINANLTGLRQNALRGAQHCNFIDSKRPCISRLWHFLLLINNSHQNLSIPKYGCPDWNFAFFFWLGRNKHDEPNIWSLNKKKAATNICSAQPNFQTGNMVSASCRPLQRDLHILSVLSNVNSVIIFTLRPILQISWYKITQTEVDPWFLDGLIRHWRIAIALWQWIIAFRCKGKLYWHQAFIERPEGKALINLLSGKWWIVFNELVWWNQKWKSW